MATESCLWNVPLATNGVARADGDDQARVLSRRTIVAATDTVKSIDSAELSG